MRKKLSISLLLVFVLALALTTSAFAGNECDIVGATCGDIIGPMLNLSW